MNDNTQKALVHSSLEALKRSALNVLYEARDKGFIRQDVVRVRLGIPKIDYSPDPARHNALIFGILMHLIDCQSALGLNKQWHFTSSAISLFRLVGKDQTETHVISS